MQCVRCLRHWDYTNFQWPWIWHLLFHLSFCPLGPLLVMSTQGGELGVCLHWGPLTVPLSHINIRQISGTSNCVPGDRPCLWHHPWKCESSFHWCNILYHVSIMFEIFSSEIFPGGWPSKSMQYPEAVQESFRDPEKELRLPLSPPAAAHTGHMQTQRWPA